MMLKDFLKRFGNINSTLIITFVCIAASVAISFITNSIIDGKDLHATLIAAVICPLIIAPLVVYFYARLTLDLDQSREELENSNEKLKAALENVNTLTGLLPICWSCRKIRDDQGYWNDLESYITDRSNACFVKGLCEECSSNHPHLAQPDKYGKNP